MILKNGLKESLGGIIMNKKGFIQSLLNPKLISLILGIIVGGYLGGLLNNEFGTIIGAVIGGIIAMRYF